MKNFFHNRRDAHRGMTLVEVLVTCGVVLILFMAIYEVFIVSIHVVTTAKARAGALAIAVERMEQVRSQGYSALGTVNGIPAGTIPQSEVVQLNQTSYIRRTIIQYVDDPADGSGAADSNGITADYKIAKVEVTWSIRGENRSLSLISTIVPPGIESVTGGGTLRVQAFDAFAAPISGASVRIVNTTGSPSVDVTTFTNTSGIVLFPGTPAGSGYQITVTKAGYSTAQTYSVSAGNPNPSPGHLSIATSQTTTASFAIDRLSSLTISTFKPIEEEVWSDLFNDVSLLAANASTTVSGGSLLLTDDGAGVFDQDGSARSIEVAPSYLYGWKEVTFSAATPPSTSARVKVYYNNSGTLTRLPDSALPGNSAGFNSGPVSLSSLSTTTYPALILVAELSTSDTAVTPSITDWNISYDKGPVPIPNVPFSLRGNKTIGTNSSGQSIYKFSNTLSSNGSGVFSTTTLEWDTYTLAIDSSANLDISEACLPLPLSIAPNTSTALNLFLSPHTSNTLLVSIKDEDTSAVIQNASVQLTRVGYDVTKQSSSCGQVFFSGLSASTYTLVISKSGYQQQTINNLSLSGQAIQNIVLTPL